MASLLGYDVSPSAMDPRLLCADCAERVGDRHGDVVREGDEWGADRAPTCCECGSEVAGLVLVRAKENR